MKKILLVMLNLVVSISFFIQCQPKKDTLTMQKKTSDFKIDYCSVTYKEKELPLGKPFKEWIKIFGKYDRFVDGLFIWDSLGIGVVIYWDTAMYSESTPLFIESRPTTEFYIFFTNLDSSLGQSGKLQYASNYFILTKEEEESLLASTSRNRPYTQEELDESRKKRVAKKPKYIYPFTTYSKTVSLQGAPVEAEMSLKEVNRERNLVKGLEKLGYWDNDGNWSNDEGSTAVKTGEFREQRAMSDLCPDQNHWYYTTLRYSEGELEYLKVSYKIPEREIQ